MIVLDCCGVFLGRGCSSNLVEFFPGILVIITTIAESISKLVALVLSESLTHHGNVEKIMKHWGLIVPRVAKHLHTFQYNDKSLLSTMEAKTAANCLSKYLHEGFALFNVWCVLANVIKLNKSTLFYGSVKKKNLLGIGNLFAKRYIESIRGSQSWKQAWWGSI